MFYLSNKRLSVSVLRKGVGERGLRSGVEENVGRYVLSQKKNSNIVPCEFRKNRSVIYLGIN